VRTRWLATRIIALLLIGSGTPAFADSTVVILRHGEKPAAGLGQLSCQGLNRALALPPLLLARYGTPTAIYAPNPALKKEDKGASYAYVRPLATVEPLAVRVGLPISLDWGMADIEPLASKLLENSEGTQIVAWEHHWAERLARRLLQTIGGNPEDVPRWQNDDFDSLYVIRIRTSASGARQTVFSHEQQELNGLSESCDK
jgi:hypothetical protein